MAAPTVAGTPVTTEITTDTDSWSVNLPSGIVSGEAVMIELSIDATDVVSNWNGWTEIASDANGANSRLAVGKKVGTGSEGSTVTITLGGAQQGSAIAYRVADTDVANIEISAAATGSSNSPNSPSHTPSGGSDDYLYHAVYGIDRNRTTTGFPSNMTTGPELSVAHSSTSGASIGADFHATSGSTSFDPNPFSTTSEGWVAYTISFPPSAAANVGTSSGTSTATANPTVSGTAAGTSTATAQSVLIKEADGSATGTSTVISVPTVIGTASGSATATGPPTVVGSAPGTSTASAASLTIKEAVGSAAGTATATATLAPSGSAAGTSTAVASFGPSPALFGFATSTETANTTNHTVTLPTNRPAGARLQVYFSSDGTLDTVTFPAGWNKVTEGVNPAQSTLTIYERIADGTEGSTITVETSGAQQSTHISLSIDRAAGTASEASTIATDFGSTPQSSVVTPSGGLDSYMWVSVYGVDRSRNATAFPSNMTSGPHFSVAGFDSAGASIGLDIHRSTASSFTPNSFSINASEGWLAFTIAIYPATDSAAGSAAGTSSAIAEPTVVGSAAGSSTASGKTIEASAGSAAGTSTASGVALEIVEATGSAAGTSTASGVELGPITQNLNGFETQSDDEDALGNATLTGYETSTPISPGSSLILDTAGGIYDVAITPAGVTDEKGPYVIGFKFAFDNNPTVASDIAELRDNAFSAIARFRLLANPTRLQVLDSNGAPLDTSPTLSPNVTQAIAVWAEFNTNPANFSWYINDTFIGSSSIADLTNGNGFGGTNTILRLVHQNATNNVTYKFDDVYVRSRCATDAARLPSTARVVAFQGGKTGQTPDFTVSGAAGGDNLDDGSWDDLGYTPKSLIDTNDAKYQTDSTTEGGAIAFNDANANGRPPGPRNNPNVGTIVAAKAHWHVKVDPGGGGNQMRGVYGRNADGSPTATVGQVVFTGLSANYINFFKYIREDDANLPASDEWAVMGFEKANGTDDLVVGEMWFHVLTDPSVASEGSAAGTSTAGAISSGKQVSVGTASGTSTAAGQSGLGGTTQAAGAAAGTSTATATPDDIFYVDSVEGLDTNPGTEALPWKTINKVAATVAPGDIVLYKKGSIFREPDQETMFDPPVSGTEAAPITFGAYGDDEDPNPIWMGSRDGTDPGFWTNLPGTDIYQSAALWYDDVSSDQYNTPIYEHANPTHFSDVGGIKLTGVEAGADRPNDASTTLDDWSQFSGNVHVFNDPWVSEDGWEPDTLILDGTVYQGTQKGSTGAITQVGDWGLIGGKFYIYSTGDPDTNYQGIAFGRLTQDGDCMVAHDGVDRWVYFVDVAGNPANSRSYFEVVDNRYGIGSVPNNEDWYRLENIEIRHCVEGIKIDFGMGNWHFENVRVQQCCRNGFNISPSAGNGGTTGNNMSGIGCGSSWQKHIGGLDRNGHGVLINQSATHVWTNYRGDYNAEDGLQSGNDFNGTLRITGLNLINNREDCFDQKGGNFDFDCAGGTLMVAGFDGNRQAMLHHNQALNLSVRNGIVTASQASGDMVSSTRAGRVITIERMLFHKSIASNKQIIQATAGSAIILRANVFQQNGNTSMFNITNTTNVTSRHNSYYMRPSTSQPMIELVGGNVLWTSINDIFVHSSYRIVAWENGSAPSGTSFQNCIFERRNSNNDWLNNNGSAIDEAEIDDGHVDGHVVIDSDCRTLEPGWINENADPPNLAITPSSPAATGRDPAAGVTNDINGNPYTTEVGAYALGPTSGVGQASGSATAAAAGLTIKAAAGGAAGSATVVGFSPSATEGTGSAAGTATATATPASSGSAAGTSQVVGATGAAARGTAAGASTAAATSKTVAAGTAAGTSTVSGRSPGPAPVIKPQPIGRSWREMIERVDGKGFREASDRPVVYEFSGGRKFKDTPGYD